MRRFLLLTAAAFASASPSVAAPLDDLALRYVTLSLEAGEREPGYVDAYYGPAALAEAAKAHPRDVAALSHEAEALAAALTAIDLASLDADSRRRRTFLIGQVTAARTRLTMMTGTRLPFADEAQGLFSVRPTLKPLSAYDPVLARAEALVPGPGPLWQRVDAYQNRFVVAADRLDPVMRAAIAGCRARTLAHIALPKDERFELQFVTKQPWSGYNWYKGNATSLIQVNTDLPVRIDRAVDLGCHEGYPGHHALNMLLEQKLAKGRGWIEFTVYPLFSPQSLIAEGSANYGIELAFPGPEKARFEARTLYPLAALNPAEAARYDRLLDALKALAGARMTIAADYLDGRIDRTEALALLQRYQLVSPERAAQSLSFTEKYRSYVINYGLGQDMVRAHVERAGPTAAMRWKAMERVISEPTVPADLLP
ncbi:hypothetical protein [uncultured Sphingomonas sp.]|uniref:hypothetical protein n=1 Tax=uncultured Sphingomonas sp. TaxID=158754 RepID=UPI0025EFA9CC|nr:hypothetical protein [uncultured Sphingomonas sp.]